MVSIKVLVPDFFCGWWRGGREQFKPMGAVNSIDTTWACLSLCRLWSTSLSLCIWVSSICIIFPTFGKVQYGFSLTQWSKYPNRRKCQASPWSQGVAEFWDAVLYKHHVFSWCHWSDSLRCWRDADSRWAIFFCSEETLPHLCRVK